MDKLDRIVAEYNNGEINYLIDCIFNGDVTLFYEYINRKRRFEDLDFDTPETEDYNNYYLFFLSNNNPEKFLDIATDALDDIFKSEDGEYYVATSDYSDIAKLFCESRNSLSPKTIESILIGDDFIDWFGSTTDDLYRDVIDDLTPENLQLLFKAIIKEQKLITADTELLEEISNDQDNNEYLELNLENLSKIFKDEDSVKSILNQLEEQGSEIKSNLYTIHGSAYTDAYYSEVYGNVMSALEDYFGNRPENVYPSENQIKFVKIELDKSKFFEYLKDFIYENRKYSEPGLSNYGSYLYLISNEDECLNAFAPDYADWDKTKENINSLFPDYI